MTDTSITLFVTTHDLEVGLARRDCPTCQSPLLLRLPSMQSAIDDRRQDSQALRLGLHDLTPTERHLFDELHAGYPRAVISDQVLAALGGISPHGLRVHLLRLRKKLAPAGWRVISRHSTLRLVAPE